MIKMEATIPRSAMSWRERSEGPKIQARVGRARRGDWGATISETRWRRVWAGRIPWMPMRPGSCGSRDKKAKR